MQTKITQSDNPANYPCVYGLIESLKYLTKDPSTQRKMVEALLKPQLHSIKVKHADQK